MIIKRIQVQEGFLDGLDLEFKEGLNVIIGPRGTGKTSVIELLRYCLDVEQLTDQSANVTEHALSILGPGKVRVTIDVGGEEMIVARTRENWTASRSGGYDRPVILSQNEIELVGLSAQGRLKLIDSIRAPGTDSSATEQEQVLLSFIRSQTEKRRSLMADLGVVRRQLNDLNEQLKDADIQKKLSAEALASVEKASTEKKRIAELNAWSAQVAVRGAFYDRLASSLQSRLLRMQSFISSVSPVETWPSAAGCADPLAEVRNLLDSSYGDLANSAQKVQDSITLVNNLMAGNRQQNAAYDEESRQLRKKLEMLHYGAGEASRKMAAIQEKIGQQSALKELEKTKLAELAALQDERKSLLSKLEIIRAAKFNVRSAIVANLNREFSPRIKISIERAGINSAYASAIIAALRGSGLRFNEIAPLIADRISPREFVEFIETENVEQLVAITGLATARAARIIERIREEGVEEILTADIEDGVTISLLDGTEYKSTEHLSMGQRCTVVLPILLKQSLVPLIVDQPEDHLDNAFVVETLIKAITTRKNKGQIIFSTHNANIPVLGGADQVVLLGSDGSRGFVKSAAPLDHPLSIAAITTVMEGGLDAFKRRSDFYQGSPVLEL